MHGATIKAVIKTKCAVQAKNEELRVHPGGSHKIKK
jgi:hypothetical protein